MITPHSFRRSFATNLYNAGEGLVHIGNKMGHTSIQTTEIYIKLYGKDLNKVVTGLEAVDSKK